MNPSELQNQAQRYFQSGLLAEALDAYSELCNLSPANPQNWHMRAAINGMLGRYQETVACCKKALELAPGAISVYANYANALIELSRHDDALVVIKKAHRLDPRDTSILAILGKLQALTGNQNSAQEAFLQILRTSPDNADAASQLARLMLDDGKVGESVAVCEQAFSYNPNHAPLLLTLVECYLNSSDLDKCRNVITNASTGIGKLAGHLVKVIRQFHTDAKYPLVISSSLMLIDIFPQEYRFYLMLADSLIRTGRSQEAITTIRGFRYHPPSYDALLLLAQAYNNVDCVDSSISCLTDAARIAPDKATPIALLSQSYQKAGKPDEALLVLESFIDGHPDCYELLVEAGNAHYRTGRYDKAEQYYKQAIKIDPDYAIAHNHLGMVYLSRKMESKAYESFTKAAALDPALVSAHSNLALLHRSNGNYEQANTCCDKALALDPEFEPAIAGKAAIYERMGDIESVMKLLEPLISSGTENTTALIIYASVAHKTDNLSRAVTLLEQALNLPTITVNERMQLHFSLGKLLDRLGEYDRAFMHYEHGNTLNNRKFNRDAQIRLTECTIKSFSSGNMKNYPKSSNKYKGLIFIVGMPRSGTTLTEQILSSHPDVFGAGELSHIRNIAAGIPATLGSSESYPLYMKDVTQGLLDKFSYYYLQNLQAPANGEIFFTDKMPANFMFLGLIELLFPNARILHCVRDPMDTCLSCYFQDFSRGQYFSYDQSDLGLYYRQYRKLMAHWKSTLSIPMMDISYEELIEDTEGLSRKMLEFAGLDWHPNCSDFHKSSRKVLTASYDQVRRPIYSSSIGRWKNYRKHLSKLYSELSEFYDAPG